MTIWVSMLLIILLIQCGFWTLFLFNKPTSVVFKNNKIKLPPLTILICAKNEADNLKLNLLSILQQDYPDNSLHIIVVNDQSDDTSRDILTDYQQDFPNLEIINIDTQVIKSLPGKKYALWQGLKAVKTDWVLLTDADCYPSSDQWARIMMQHITDTQTKFVLGYGAYEQTGPKLLNKFLRWETLHTFIQYATYAQSLKPYMGVGRNLLYEKEIVLNLFEDDNFRSHISLVPSGDDDLIITALASKANTKICADPFAKTISKSPNAYAVWWKQKTRHLSSGKLYPNDLKKILGLYGLSHGLFWLILCSFPFLNLHDFEWICVIIMIVTRLILSFLTGLVWSRKVGESKNLGFFIIGDFSWALYNLILSPYIFWKNKQQWK